MLVDCIVCLSLLFCVHVCFLDALFVSLSISSVFTVRETTALFYLDIPNIPPTVTAEEDNNNKAERAGCDTTSGHYKDGDVFSSNSTGIRPTSDDQCVMCVCQVGLVMN